MKTLRLLATLAITALVAACATSSQTENLLTAAGFQTRVASTPAQQALLKSLPVGKISPIQHKGNTLFAYPDPANNVVYVGRQQEYTAFEKLREQRKIAKDKVWAAEFNQEASWDAWGGALSDGWYVF